jgi:hypothetical protein
LRIEPLKYRLIAGPQWNVHGRDDLLNVWSGEEKSAQLAADRYQITRRETQSRP